MPDIILDLAGIDGESNVDGFDNKIICESFSFGASQPVDYSRNTARTTGTVNVSDISLTRNYDISSTELLAALFAAKSWDTCTIHFLKAANVEDAGQAEFLKITLTNPIISNLSFAGSAGGMSESLTISFTKIEFEYKVQAEGGELGGAVTAEWDVLAGKGG
jgi:type VI secretion system secreted protein Hcp